MLSPSLSSCVIEFNLRVTSTQAAVCLRQGQKSLYASLTPPVVWLCAFQGEGGAHSRASSTEGPSLTLPAPHQHQHRAQPRPVCVCVVVVVVMGGSGGQRPEAEDQRGIALHTLSIINSYPSNAFIESNLNNIMETCGSRSLLCVY